eukprot:CAMPEP_0117748832 /NCGR_PEP_ID=MMETSP0947-20121206/9384_1 /TAXON_ID=44440 /ORGANISM="Chattonella subsalsa, Strain CCMP2191" /LENGTH=1168 /DNA_ID=CAMNT_0005566637 /DNA_START=368 /DNA_END=3874 /DNA_ORIENTATION=-
MSSQRLTTSLPSLVPPSPPAGGTFITEDALSPAFSSASQPSSRQDLLRPKPSNQGGAGSLLSPQELKRRKMERIVKRQAARIAYLENRLDSVRVRKATEVIEMKQAVELDRHRAATVIQKAEKRRKHRMEHIRQENAACILQKLERGRQGRVAAQRRHSEVRNMNKQAAVIQARFRGHNARLKSWKQQLYEDHLIKCATLIQSAYRGHVSRVYYHKLLASLALMQAVVRGRVTRKRVIKIRRELRNMAQGAENIQGLASEVVNAKNKKLISGEITNLKVSAENFKTMEGEFMLGENGDNISFLDNGTVLKIKNEVEKEVKNIEKATRKVKQFANGRSARKIVHEMMTEMTAMNQSVGTIESVAELTVDDIELLARPSTQGSSDSGHDMLAKAVRRMLSGKKALEDLQPDEVCKVLEAKRFGSWVICFSRNNVDGQMLADPDLSEEDLAELGIEIRVDRSRLLRLFKNYREKGVPLHDFRTEKEVVDILRKVPEFDHIDFDASRTSSMDSSKRYHRSISHHTSRSISMMSSSSADETKKSFNAKSSPALINSQAEKNGRLESSRSTLSSRGSLHNRRLSTDDRSELTGLLAAEIFSKDLKHVESETALIRPTEKQKEALKNKEVADAGKVLEVAMEAVSLLGPMNKEKVKEVQELASTFVTQMNEQIRSELHLSEAQRKSNLFLSTPAKSQIEQKAKKHRLSYQLMMEHRGVDFELVDSFVSAIILEAVEGNNTSPSPNSDLAADVPWNVSQSDAQIKKEAPRRRSSLVLTTVGSMDEDKDRGCEENPISISLNTGLAMVNPNSSAFSARHAENSGVEMINRNVNAAYLKKVVDPDMEENRFPDDRTEYDSSEEESLEREKFDESIFMDANGQETELLPPATPDENAFSMDMTLRSPDKVHALDLQEDGHDHEEEQPGNYLDLQMLAAQNEDLDDFEMMDDIHFRRLSKISERSHEADTPFTTQPPEAFQVESKEDPQTKKVEGQESNPSESCQGTFGDTYSSMAFDNEEDGEEVLDTNAQDSPHQKNESLTSDSSKLQQEDGEVAVAHPLKKDRRGSQVLVSFDENPPSADSSSPPTGRRISISLRNEVAEVSAKDMTALSGPIPKENLTEKSDAADDNLTDEISQSPSNEKPFQNKSTSSKNDIDFEMNFEESFDDTDDVDDLNVIS